MNNEKEHLVLKDCFIKMGIWEYMEDDRVTGIMVNSNKTIYIAGNLSEEETDTGLIADPNVTMVIMKILATLSDDSVTDKSPYLTGTVPFMKSRFEGLIPPIVENPSFSIRKKIPVVKEMKDYLNDNFIDEKIYNYLEKSVTNKKNILIVGGTNTGKTTFTNALLGLFDSKERVILIEEIEELQCKNKNKINLKPIPGIFTPTQALKSCMRLEPDRIIFGEVRGVEAFDLLMGLNSGHPGGITTIHADDCYSGLSKFELYLQMAQNDKFSFFIAKTIDIIITIKIKKIDGKKIRYLSEIAECLGYEDNKYILKEFYKGD